MINDIFHYGSYEGFIAIGLLLIGLSGMAIVIYTIFLLANKIELHIKNHEKTSILIANLLMCIVIFVIGYVLIITSIIIIVNRYYGCI